MFQVSAKIIYNNKIKKNYFEIALTAQQIAKSALPGQFVNIKVSDGSEPLLRRPLSIHRIGRKVARSQSHTSKEKEFIVMLYEVVGKGTEILSTRKAGEYLDVIGPLGNGFDYEGRPPQSAGGRPPEQGGGGGGEGGGAKDEGRWTNSFSCRRNGDGAACVFGGEIKGTRDERRKTKDESVNWGKDKG